MRVTNSIMGMTMLVVVACSMSASPANASAMVVPEATGTWVVANNEICPEGSCGGSAQLGAPCCSGELGTIPGIHPPTDPTPYCQSQIVMNEITSCTWTWSGKMKGDPLQFPLVTTPLPPPDNVTPFYGAVAEGTYTGQGLAQCFGVAGGFCDPLSWDETAQFTFTGTWGIGWYSKGSFTGESSASTIGGAQLFINQSFSGPVETFTSFPAIPEPSTLLMLGSGVFGLAVVLRRKLTR